MKEATTFEQEKAVFAGNGNQVTLSTGKVVLIRERKGQHHIIESRLLSSCAQPSGENGINIGELILANEIKTAVAIEEVDDRKLKIPSSLADVFELANLFSYEEWDELKEALQMKRDEMEAAAKNLQASAGFAKE